MYVIGGMSRDILKKKLCCCSAIYSIAMYQRLYELELSRTKGTVPNKVSFGIKRQERSYSQCAIETEDCLFFTN